jgi:hypothetical protein
VHAKTAPFKKFNWSLYIIVTNLLGCAANKYICNQMIIVLTENKHYFCSFWIVIKEDCLAHVEWTSQVRKVPILAYPWVSVVVMLETHMYEMLCPNIAWDTYLDCSSSWLATFFPSKRQISTLIMPQLHIYHPPITLSLTHSAATGGVINTYTSTHAHSLTILSVTFMPL